MYSRLKVFENRVLWRKVGPKRKEVVGGWRSFVTVRFTKY
jgi:hypothetical protein